MSKTHSTQDHTQSNHVWEKKYMQETVDEPVKVAVEQINLGGETEVNSTVKPQIGSILENQ